MENGKWKMEDGRWKMESYKVESTGGAKCYDCVSV